MRTFLFLALSIACSRGGSGARTAPPERQVERREPPEAPRRDEGCPQDGRAYLTIAVRMTRDCRGGQYYIDGILRGEYPVKCAPVPPGRHVVHVRSRNDCAGYGSRTILFEPGRETKF